MCVDVYAFKTQKPIYLLVDQQRPAFSASAAKLHPNPNCETHKLATGDQEKLTQESPRESTSSAPAEVAVPAVTPPPLSAAVEVTVSGDVSVTGHSSTTGCNCFGGKKCKKRWASAKNTDTPEMSEVYCPSCEDPSNQSPACLAKMPDKRPTRLKPKSSILSVESELLVGKRSSFRLPSEIKRKQQGGSITRSASLSAADRRTSLPVATKRIIPPRLRTAKAKDLEKDKEKEKDKNKENDKKSSNQKVNGSATNFLAKMSPKRLKAGKEKDKDKDGNKEKEKDKFKAMDAAKKKAVNNNNPKPDISKSEEYEIADDATSLNGSESEPVGAAKMVILSESDSKLMISVRGREELPVVDSPKTPPKRFEKCVSLPVEPESHLLQPDENNENEQSDITNVISPTELTPMLDVANGNGEANSATLPRTAKQAHVSKMLHLVPKRRTPDGTNIYYWCDVPKKAIKGYFLGFLLQLYLIFLYFDFRVLTFQ